MPKITPRTNFQATQWGFTTRDFAIIGVGFLLAIAQVITPYASIFIRLIIFAVVVLGSVTFAFWRVDRVLTIEEYLVNKFKYWRGVRNAYTKTGAEYLSRRSYTDYSSEDTAKLTPTARGKVLWRLPAWLTPESNQDLVFTTLSVFFILAFTAWVGAGGIEEMQVLVKNYIRGL